MESGLPDWPPPWNGFFHFFSEPSLRLLLFIFNDEMKIIIGNYFGDNQNIPDHLIPMAKYSQFFISPWCQEKIKNTMNNYFFLFFLIEVKYSQLIYAILKC